MRVWVSVMKWCFGDLMPTTLLVQYCGQNMVLNGVLAVPANVEGQCARADYYLRAKGTCEKTQQLAK